MVLPLAGLHVDTRHFQSKRVDSSKPSELTRMIEKVVSALLNFFIELPGRIASGFFTAMKYVGNMYMTENRANLCAKVHHK